VTHPGIDAIRQFLAAVDFGTGTVEQRRATMEATAGSVPAPDGVVVEPDTVGGRPAEWLRPEGHSRGNVLLYLHGGGYCAGSLDTHRNLAGRLALAADLSVCNLDYRLGPEHPHPAAVDDAVAAVRDLVERGHDPSGLAIAGDSAGGGLTVCTLLALRDSDGPMPAAAACMSPWTDLTQSAETYETRSDADPMVTKDGLDLYAAAYLGDADPQEPLVSPRFADLGELPPIMIEVGDAEVLLDDAVGLAEELEAHGVDVALRVWPEMVHVFQAFTADLLPEADQSVADIAAFLRRHLTDPRIA
jgi:acetyl esterase/lipase